MFRNGKKTRECVWERASSRQISNQIDFFLPETDTGSQYYTSYMKGDPRSNLSALKYVRGAEDLNIQLKRPSDGGFSSLFVPYNIR